MSLNTYETLKLKQYGGKMVEINDRPTVQLISPNDNAACIFQYRRSIPNGIERRVLRRNGEPFIDSGSPWQALSLDEFLAMRQNRGQWHPILDPLGF